MIWTNLCCANSEKGVQNGETEVGKFKNSLDDKLQQLQYQSASNAFYSECGKSNSKKKKY